MDAIIYTTNTGSTQRYAQLLAEETGLPVFSLKQAEKSVRPGSEAIYLGWIMAGRVKGYTEAARRFRVRAVCAVGMGQTGTQTQSVREKTGVPDGTPVFTLQGGFDVRKLHGACRLMMELMVRTAGRGLERKPDRTPEESDMLEMMLRGGDRVSPQGLRGVLAWYAMQS